MLALTIPRLRINELARAGHGIAIIFGWALDDIVIGAKYRINDVLAVVTQPRIPCYKLGARMNDAEFPNRFWTAGRLGFYLRVEQGGTIATAQALELVDTPLHGITIQRLYEIVCSDSNVDAAFALDNLPHLDAGWLRRLRQSK